MATPRTTPSKPKVKPAASFSLEAAEKEYAESERPEPFTIDIGDGEGLVTLSDPQELSVSEIGNLRDETPLLALRTLTLSDQDYERIMARGLTLNAYTKMLTAWKDHYGQDAAGN